jgi:hypothetical protein
VKNLSPIALAFAAALTASPGWGGRILTMKLLPNTALVSLCGTWHGAGFQLEWNLSLFGVLSQRRPQSSASIPVIVPALHP